MLHRKGIGVILDWVPAYFPDDPHELARFDGTPLYEDADPRRGRHPEWDSCVFDYGRPEVRAVFGYMWAHPGKKLLFMGNEFGQRHEWRHDGELDWAALRDPRHAGLRLWVGDLNHLYRESAALHDFDFDAAGFAWVEAHDGAHSLLAFLRRGRDGQMLLVVGNFTPVQRDGYVIGVPQPGCWREVLNSAAEAYGGRDIGNLGSVEARPQAAHGHPCSLCLTLPPMALRFFRPPDPV